MLMISRSSLSPTERKILFASSGDCSIRRMTISFTSRSWSMLRPIRSKISWTMFGYCCSTRLYTRSRISGVRSRQSRGCSRRTARSTSSLMSSREDSTM